MVGSFFYKLKLLRRSVKYFFQRLFHGFDDSETWCLTTSHARWMVPRLERFICIRAGYPSQLSSSQEWSEILINIQSYFKVLATGRIPFQTDDDYLEFLKNEKLYEKWKYNLWW